MLDVLTIVKTAATMTMNSPESLVQLHKLVSEQSSQSESVYLAELIREIGLKCIGFNGVRFFSLRTLWNYS